MDAVWLKSNWALVLALSVALVLVAASMLHALRVSARGQLRRACKDLAAERRRYRKAEAQVSGTAERKARLEKRASKVRPRELRESVEALADAEALAKIALDNVAVAENHVRRVIFEEFPPTQHARLRTKYLPDRPVDRKPFTF